MLTTKKNYKIFVVPKLFINFLLFSFPKYNSKKVLLFKSPAKPLNVTLLQPFTRHANKFEVVPNGQNIFVFRFYTKTKYIYSKDLKKIFYKK